MLDFNLRSLFIRIVAVVVAFPLHEAAHAFASYLLGDPTARRMGRLTINPLAHVDPIGLFSLIFLGFGWGKPVPVNPRYYKDAKTGMIWTAFAGPCMNFVLAFVCVFLYMLLQKISFSFCMTTIGSLLLDIFAQTAYISLGLGVFNCIPIPPLDGSKVLLSFLPEEQYFKFIENGKWMTFILIALIYTGVLSTPLIRLESQIIGIFSSFVTSLLF